MGGHADYNGYAVVAAALAQDFAMAVSVVPEGEDGDKEIQISNSDKSFE